MTKEVIKKIYILIGVFSLVFNINSNLYVKDDKINQTQNIQINQTKNPTIEIPKTVKIKSDKNITINHNKNDQKQLSLNISSNKTLSRGGILEYDTIFELTFYSGLVCENSKYGAVTYKGIKLFDGVAANNVLPYKTKIKLEGWGTVQVLDIGGNSFESAHRLDIYVPRIKGESDSKYYKRVQTMGRIKVKGKIIS